MSTDGHHHDETAEQSWIQPRIRAFILGLGREAVRKAIHDGAKGGGFILSTCHSHSYVDPLRLKWMVEAAHEYGRYPITT